MATTSKASRITRDKVEAFLERVRAMEKPCEYGHCGCSDRVGGPCMDEVLHLHPDSE